MVFYFTGTGNCLYIAKQLEAQPVSIPQVIHQENLHFCDKSIGIVAPVYGHEVPGMVKEFLHRATFDTDYFYMILTYGNRHGGAAELAAQMENLDSYDIIFLGYPNWNADLPMPLYTLLEQTDLSGKTIVPFTTHGGSGFSRTIQTIQELQPNATVISDGLSISRNGVAQAEGDVASWVSGLGLIG